MAGFGGGEGQAAPGVDIGRIDLRGLVEYRVSLNELALMNEILGVSDEQTSIAGGSGEELEKELVGAGEVGSVRKDGGQHAGNGGVAGVGGVKLLQKREGLGLVLIGEHGSELGGERWVVWIFGEGGAKEGFGSGDSPCAG